MKEPPPLRNDACETPSIDLCSLYHQPSQAGKENLPWHRQA